MQFPTDLVTFIEEILNGKLHSSEVFTSLISLVEIKGKIKFYRPNFSSLSLCNCEEEHMFNWRVVCFLFV